jgi:hypothetical protein
MRLIDADALKDYYGKWSNNHTEFLKPEIDRYIDAQPTIDPESLRKKGEWDMFSLITSVYFGKEYYFLEKNDVVYSRLSHEYKSREGAIQEFLDYLEVTDG